jgi:8-hydroxy-5-deazaflavin:NADPH oxidoreductase
MVVPKKLIDNIPTKFGWETIDIGGTEGARLLEPLTFLWITDYFGTCKQKALIYIL